MIVVCDKDLSIILVVTFWEWIIIRFMFVVVGSQLKLQQTAFPPLAPMQTTTICVWQHAEAEKKQNQNLFEQKSQIGADQAIQYNMPGGQAMTEVNVPANPIGCPAKCWGQMQMYVTT